MRSPDGKHDRIRFDILEASLHFPIVSPDVCAHRERGASDCPSSAPLSLARVTSAVSRSGMTWLWGDVPLSTAASVMPAPGASRCRNQ